MKKLFLLILAAGLVVSQAAFSQDKNVLNHVAIGVSAGTDGLGASLALPLGNHFQIRGGYTTMQPILGMVKLNVEGNEIPLSNANLSLPISYHDDGMNVDKVDLATNINFNHAHLLFDYLPSEFSGFHLSFGAYFAFAPLAHAVGTALDNNGANGVPQSDWANTRFYGISTNTSGEVIADAKFLLNNVKPYLGIGFGRPVSLKHRVGFNFDLGMLMTGGLHVYSYDFSSDPAEPVDINEDWVAQYDDVKKAIGGKVEILNAMNSLPIWPLLKFSLFVRLF